MREDGRPTHADGALAGGAVVNEELLPAMRAGWQDGEHLGNPWDEAKRVVSEADEESVRAACAHLLGLLWHDRQTDVPEVAMRNVRKGDVLRLSGSRVKVLEVHDTAENRGPHRAIGLLVQHNPFGGHGFKQTYRYQAYVRVPLLARELED